MASEAAAPDATATCGRKYMQHATSVSVRVHFSHSGTSTSELHLTSRAPITYDHQLVSIRTVLCGVLAGEARPQVAAIRARPDHHIVHARVDTPLVADAMVGEHVGRDRECEFFGLPGLELLPAHANVHANETMLRVATDTRGEAAR